MSEIDAVADMIIQSKKVVVFTGAGISTESGISDFRSPGGIWDKFDANEFTYQKFVSAQANREMYWNFSKTIWRGIDAAKPNSGHYAIADLHKLGKLDCVITQNIDYLHERSGIPSEKIIELHGTLKWVVCLGCGKRYPRPEIQLRLEAGEIVPLCDSCGGILKPATVMFGQSMPEAETYGAQARSASCDLFMAVGSSLVVYPAAQMPVIAKHGGAKLVIINMTPTPHDHQADVLINKKTGETLSQIIERVKAKSNV